MITNETQTQDQHHTDQMKEYAYWLFIVVIMVVIVVIVVVDVVVVIAIVVIIIVAIVEIDDGSGTKIVSEFIERLAVKWIIHTIV